MLAQRIETQDRHGALFTIEGVFDLFHGAGEARLHVLREERRREQAHLGVLVSEAADDVVNDADRRRIVGGGIAALEDGNGGRLLRLTPRR